MRRSLITVLGLGVTAGIACGGAGASETEVTGTTRARLTATDPVSDAVTAGCSTVSVKGLATQLVQEIQCMRPGTLKSIESLSGLTLGEAVFPYLQAPAADALATAQKARGTTLSINSALRTLPQQYLLYRWYKTGRCGISLAALPGKSNHETAVAIDIEDSSGWRSSLTNAGFRWLGSSDPVHYDFTGAGAVDLRGISITAFQRLWNRNHPEDRIDEDGLYGDETEKRLARSPVGGFPIGADTCADAGTVVAPPPLAPEPDPVPDATEPPAEASDDGCTVTRAPGAGGTASALVVLALSAIGLGARRRGAARGRRPSTRGPT